MKCLKDRYLVAEFREITCTGKTGRTRTDDSDLDAVCLLRLLRNNTVLSGPVSYETLELTDGDSLALDAADTLALALALLRADTSADSRKRGGSADDLCSLCVISFFYFFYECRDIDLNRTSLYTSRVFAV